MKKLSYLLMAISLVFCVSCTNKNDKTADDSKATATEKENTNTDNTPKYTGSPAFVEIMTYFDETETKLENCTQEQYKEIHDITYETVLGKYGENDVTPEENETLRVRWGEFVNNVAEKAKDFGMNAE